MTDISAQNAAFYWATVFFRRLQQLGIKHVVISPGSRSTPLTLSAATNDQLQKHVILDERSAAFTALGIGKNSNMPAVLICTSGTALANYYPAVIEARKSGIPLILATADRPPHMRATGSNQAVDQLKIFGDYPVFFHEAGEPVIGKEDLSRLSMLAGQAVTASREQRGPVHLNFPFRKPLEPEADFLQEISDENRERLKDPTAESDSLYSGEKLALWQETVENISKAERPLIIVGPTAPGDDTGTIASLARQLQCPVISESSIDYVFTIAGYNAFLSNENVRTNLAPDLILRFGFQPTSKGITSALKQWSPDHHIHFAGSHDWHDATFSITRRIPWMGRKLSFPEFTGSVVKGWTKRWQEAGTAFLNRYEEVFSKIGTITDGHVYRHFTPQISREHFITVSNSFPARDIHLFGKQDPAIPLFLNRGTSGIDGVTSTAMGISISSDRPGVLFTGDLAFLHDSNALLNHRLLIQPLAVIIIDNSGGSVFRMLPVQQHEQYFQTYFETPQSVDIEQLAGSHGLPYYRATSIETLHKIDLQRIFKQHKGLSIIECKTDAEASMKLRNQLWGSA